MKPDKEFDLFKEAVVISASLRPTRLAYMVDMDIIYWMKLPYYPQ